VKQRARVSSVGRTTGPLTSLADIATAAAMQSQLLLRLYLHLMSQWRLHRHHPQQGCACFSIQALFQLTYEQGSITNRIGKSLLPQFIPCSIVLEIRAITCTIGSILRLRRQYVLIALFSFISRLTKWWSWRIQYLVRRTLIMHQSVVGTRPSKRPWCSVEHAFTRYGYLKRIMVVNGILLLETGPDDDHPTPLHMTCQQSLTLIYQLLSQSSMFPTGSPLHDVVANCWRCFHDY